MKCRRCPKQATLHITEILAPKELEEIHLCEDCAKKYLYESTPKKNKAAVPAASGVDLNDEPATKGCEECGLKFVEFRNTGRLGCSRDYDLFREELLPLLESIHGDVKHQGKSPKRAPKASHSAAEIAKLRKKLQQAVQSEAYEEAAKLRDRLKELEGD